MEIFPARLRRIGNSLGVLVPKPALDALAAREGDEVEVALLPPRRDREAALRRFLGSAPSLQPFERDRRDRY